MLLEVGHRDRDRPVYRRNWTLEKSSQRKCLSLCGRCYVCVSCHQLRDAVNRTEWFSDKNQSCSRARMDLPAQSWSKHAQSVRTSTGPAE